MDRDCVGARTCVQVLRCESYSNLGVLQSHDSLGEIGVQVPTLLISAQKHLTLTVPPCFIFLRRCIALVNPQMTRSR